MSQDKKESNSIPFFTVVIEDPNKTQQFLRGGSHQLIQTMINVLSLHKPEADDFDLMVNYLRTFGYQSIIEAAEFIRGMRAAYENKSHLFEFDFGTNFPVKEQKEILNNSNNMDFK